MTTTRVVQVTPAASKTEEATAPSSASSDSKKTAPTSVAIPWLFQKDRHLSGDENTPPMTYLRFFPEIRKPELFESELNAVLKEAEKAGKTACSEEPDRHVHAEFFVKTYFPLNEAQHVQMDKILLGKTLGKSSL
ncbi:MAG: hypothetical protein ACYCQI_07425 [Gammaproteobacteria bacterium]